MHANLSHAKPNRYGKVLGPDRLNNNVFRVSHQPTTQPASQPTNQPVTAGLRLVSCLRSITKLSYNEGKARHQPLLHYFCFHKRGKCRRTQMPQNISGTLHPYPIHRKRTEVYIDLHLTLYFMPREHTRDVLTNIVDCIQEETGLPGSTSERASRRQTG